MFVARQWPHKDPSDILDYSFDWSEQLRLPPAPDTINEVVWTVPQGLSAGATYEADGVTTIWLSGGTAGTDYVITCRIITEAGRVLERSSKLSVRQL